jgi:hypothetical protein
MADGALTLGLRTYGIPSRTRCHKPTSHKFSRAKPNGALSKQFSEPAVLFWPRSEHCTARPPDPGRTHHKSPALIERHAYRIRPFHLDSYSALSSALIALLSQRLTTTPGATAIPHLALSWRTLLTLSGCCGSY